MTGRIIKGIAGFYYIAAGGRVYTCKAKGLFRKLSLKPLVGDIVDFTLPEGDSEGNVTCIHERKNELIRPAVANVDLIVITLAVAKPEPALYLLDKYLVYIKQANIPAAIVFNKTDLGCGDRLNEYKHIYENALYRVLETSTYDSSGLDELSELIRGKTIVLAGPSGVGKSSITNSLCTGLNVQTNVISRKIDRGKHTTRHSELFMVGKDTYLCDTPGFTAVDIGGCDETSLKEYFPEFSLYSDKCRFNGCNHISEPDCEVKRAVEEGRLPRSRYESYTKLYEELSRRKRF